MTSTARSSNDVDHFVGQKLKSLRKSARMSQTELGELVGITFQQIQKYERGNNRISASRLWEFSIIFNVNPGFFFEGLNVMTVSNKAKNTPQKSQIILA